MATFFLQDRIRYFVYLSRVKVAMLYQQIQPGIREKLAGTLRIQVPFVEVEFTPRALNQNDFDMLKIVLTKLDKDGVVGTVDRPAGYFAGQLPLRWGSWDDFVFFSGRSDRSLVGMAGSFHHLAQLPADLPSVSIGSTVVGMNKSLEAAFGDEEAESAADSLIHRATMATVLTRQAARPMEFVARRLAVGDTSIDAANWKIHRDFEDLRHAERLPMLLGSPLYVAEVD